MLSVDKFSSNDLLFFLETCKRENFPFNEYKALKLINLQNNYSNHIQKLLNDEAVICLKCFKSAKLLGVVSCSKDSFDSEIFGFGCYRITDLQVFSENLNEIVLIIKSLLGSLEEEILQNEKKYYISISLNNNISIASFIFNAIVQNQYYYIHTLLTFSSKKINYNVKSYYSNENILIRTATHSDAEAISELAKNSFKYSRFHMDPFLDNEKASLLLQTSAINSIINNFVDIMYIAEINHKVVGYYSAKKRKNDKLEKVMGEAVISAVDINYRGIGIFGKLDSHILNWFNDNTDFAEMGTYLINYPVHKTWINKGLGIIRGSHQFSKMVFKANN